MNRENRRTAILNVRYSKFQPVQPVLDQLVREGLDSAILLRGRMTAQDAWYELEIQGAPEAVDSVITDDRRGADRFSRLILGVA